MLGLSLTRHRQTLQELFTSISTLVVREKQSPACGFLTGHEATMNLPLTGWPPMLCWQGLGNNSQLCSHQAMGALPLADASLDRRRQNAYKSTRREGRPLHWDALRRRRRGEEALRTRGALKTPGARVSGRWASVRRT